MYDGCKKPPSQAFHKVLDKPESIETKHVITSERNAAMA